MGLSPSRFGWSFLLAWVFCVFYLGTIDCRFLIEPALHSKSLPFLTQLIVSGLPVFASIATIGYAIAIEPRMGEIADRPRMRVVSPLIASIGTIAYFLPLTRQHMGTPRLHSGIHGYGNRQRLHVASLGFVLLPHPPRSH